jgi:hypothetical protein
LVPAWANFFDDAAFGAFVDEVERDLARRGHAVIEDGVADLEIEGGDRHRLGLQNLAQLCNQVERDDWPELVREHFDRVILSTQTHDLDALSHDFEAVKPLLKVRLYARESLGELETNTVYRPLGDELAAVLVYDLPDAVATVPIEAPSRWPVDLDDVFALALTNVLEQDEVECETFELDDGTRFHAMLGDSFFVTSRLLVLEHYLEPATPLGAIVAVPNRHTLLFSPIVDASVIDAIHAMAVIAYERWSEGPGSLVPTLLWWRAGRLIPLPTEVDDDGVHFDPPDEFVDDCLDRLPRPSGYGPN